MKHEVHMIWTSNQMRKIWMKNMRIIHNDKEKCTCFDKKISSRSFFMICFSWMSKRRELMIIFWHMNHENMKHENRKEHDEKKHETDKDHDFNFDWNEDLKLDMKHELWR